MARGVRAIGCVRSNVLHARLSVAFSRFYLRDYCRFRERSLRRAKCVKETLSADCSQTVGLRHLLRFAQLGELQSDTKKLKQQADAACEVRASLDAGLRPPKAAACASRKRRRLISQILFLSARLRVSSYAAAVRRSLPQPMRIGSTPNVRLRPPTGPLPEAGCRARRSSCRAGTRLLPSRRPSRRTRRP